MSTCRKCGHAHDCEKLQARRKKLQVAEQKRLRAERIYAADQRQREIERQHLKVLRAAIFQMDCNGVARGKIEAWVRGRLTMSVAYSKRFVTQTLADIWTSIEYEADDRFLPCGSEDKPHSMTRGGLTGRWCMRPGCRYVEFLHCASDIPFTTACGRRFPAPTIFIGAIVTCAECCAKAGITQRDGTGRPVRFTLKPDGGYNIVLAEKR